MKLHEAIEVLKSKGFMCEALKNEKAHVYIPILNGEKNKCVIWSVWYGLDVEKDELVIEDKDIQFAEKSEVASTTYYKQYSNYNENPDERVPESATRSISSAITYIKKHPEWCNNKLDLVTPERFKNVLESDLNWRNEKRMKDRVKRERNYAVNQFKEELQMLLQKYDARIGANCYTEYDEATGEVWVEFKNGDSLNLIDVDNKEDNFYFGDDNG